MCLNETLSKTIQEADKPLHVMQILESPIGQSTCRMSDKLTFCKLILVEKTLSSKFAQRLLGTYRVKHLRVDPSVILCRQYWKLMTHNLYNMMQWSLLLRPLLFSDYLSFKTVFSCTEFWNIIRWKLTFTVTSRIRSLFGSTRGGRIRQVSLYII